MITLTRTIPKATLSAESVKIHCLFDSYKDDDKVLFEGLWPIPMGVSYNSYVVVDEKIALIDTVEGGFEEEFLSNIAEAI